MSLSAMQFAVKARLERATDKLVLTYLCWHKNEETGLCYPSTALLLQETSLDRHTLINSIKRLETLGFIRKISQTGRVNFYEILETSDKNNTSAENNITSVEINTSGEIHTSEEIHTAPVLKTTQHQCENPHTKGKERRVKEKIGLPYETLPFEWWVACRDIRKDLNPKAVFDEFKDYWLSDSAKGNGLKSDWLRTWKNWVRNTKVKPFNAAPSSGIAVRNLLESLYRETEEEAKAEQWFFEKTGMHDFGREEEPQKPKDNQQEQEVRSFIRSVLAGGGLSLQGASKNA